MTEWNNDTVRALERSSIRTFMEKNREYLFGKVLDFGAGKQPYRDLVVGEYVPYELGDSGVGGSFDVIMCNQVMQYLAQPLRQLELFHAWLFDRRGYLALTYPTNWDEVEASDYWRFTKSGMERLLDLSLFAVIKHERRAEINLNGFRFPLGYGVIAQAR